MNTPIGTLLKLAALGGRLSIAGDKLRVLHPANSPNELKDSISQHKSTLLNLLRLKFIVVQADAVDAILFWTPEEETKTALILAGAIASNVYTRSELAAIAQSRITSQQLLLIHTTKRFFAGRVVPQKPAL
jgi:hypothetical protein